ncbi:MAG: hypothetical protein RLZZ139_4280, partial [Cyanobacteriota bacterium]
ALYYTQPIQSVTATIAYHYEYQRSDFVKTLLNRFLNSIKIFVLP